MAQWRLIKKSIVVRCVMTWNFVMRITNRLARKLLVLTGWEAQASAMYRGNSSTRNTHQANGPARAYSIHPIIVCLIGIAGFQPVIFVFAAERCVAPAATRVVSVQGNVTWSIVGSAALEPAKLNDLLCVGDTVRVGAKSRAVLRLPNETTIPLDQNTVFQLKQPISEKEPTLIELIQGAIHVITRTPKPFKVNTPFMNAAVEGTEFYVGVDAEEARVAVIEGKVNVSNEQGALLLTDNEAATAKKGQAPQKTLTIKPRDAVQWALYYPPLFDPRSRTGGQNLSASYELYSQGKITGAIESLDPIPETERNGDYYTYRAGLLLLVGRADEADPDIETALKENASNTDALSLTAIIAIVQNDKVRALELANQAVNIDHQSASARIALSYALQANFKIEDALKAAREATERDANNALAWARVAELELSIPNYDKSKEAAERAVKLNPNLARTQSVLGFASLTRIDIKAAKDSFNTAIQLDQADPLPRLGLGLALVREGKLVEGREQIEIATSLDPENSLIRSYLGKAYYDERRDELAGRQLELAKERDPKDPTPYLYDANIKQSQHRPLEALSQVEKSIELNDNRAIFRSRMTLDQDASARGSTLARIFDELGFQEIALLEAYVSTTADPANPSAHRFLADAYAGRPRHEIARVSELLQSQLLQSINTAPVQPDLADDRQNAFKAGVSKDIGFGRPGFSEYGAAFDSDGIRLNIDGIVGNRATRGDQVILSGINGKTSYSLGQFHFETNGISDSNDFKRDIYDVFVQSSISPIFNVQAEFRYSDSSKQDTFFPFDPDITFSRTLYDKTKNFRLGGHIKPSPYSDFLLSAIWQRRDLDIAISDFPRFRALESEALTTEIQHIGTFGRFQLTSGVGHLDSDDESIPIRATERVKHDNAYVYGSVRDWLQRFWLQIGIGGDNIHRDDSERGAFKRYHLSPKIGVVWHLTPSTVLRAASFHSVKRQLIGNQTIEPTQVAGFNQFFDDPNGTISRRSGIGLDHQFPRDVQVGLELTRRVLDIEAFGIGTAEKFYWRERMNRGHVYWALPSETLRAVLPRWGIALGAEAQYERLERDEGFTGAEGIAELKTYFFPVSVRLFRNNGFAFRVTSTQVRQKGTLLGLNRVTPSDRFWTTDVALSYRFPRRYGLVAFGVKNLTDRDFIYTETDTNNPRLANGRFVYGRLVLTF